MVQVVGNYKGSRPWAPNEAKACSYPITPAPDPTPASALNLTAANRRAALPGLYDWSKAGFRQGAALPASGNVNTSEACTITPAELEATYNVTANFNDDSDGLQRSIDDIKANCSPAAGYSNLSLIQLPAGQIDVSKQIYVDADYLGPSAADCATPAPRTEGIATPPGVRATATTGTATVELT